MEAEQKIVAGNRNRPFFLYLLFLLFLLFLHIEFYEYAADDAFIHFRVARNFVETGYPYYNHDEPLKVSTSSGWVVLLSSILAFATKIGSAENLPFLVALFNAFTLTIILYLYTAILETVLQKDVSIVVGLLLQIPCIAILLPSSIELMETPLAILVVGVGIHYLLHKNTWGLMFLSFAVHIRPEMVVPLVLAILVTLKHKHYKLMELFLPVLIGLVPMIVYDFYYFNTIIPHSVIAKKVVYSFTHLDTIVSTVLGALPSVKRPNHIVFLYLMGVIPRVIFFCALITTTFAALINRKRMENLWPLFFGFSSLLTISGYVVGRAFIFDWYRPLYAFPAILALTIFTFSPAIATRRIARIAMALALLVSIISLAQYLYATAGNRSYASIFVTGARVKTYLVVARILNDNYPKATLLTSEIGGTGYTFRGKIYDAVGLASADAVSFHPMKIPLQRESGSIGAIPPEYVKAKNPDIIVSHDIFAKALQASEIIKQYNALRVPVYLPEDAKYSESKSLWGSRYHNIYIKKGLPISQDLKLFAESGEIVQDYSNGLAPTK